MINRTLGRTSWMLGLSLFWMASASAQATMDHRATGHMAQPAAKAERQAMTEGEVRKIDPKAQTLTLQHGPIPSLDMPAMTMAFKVKSAALLNQVKAGDRVRFSAEMPAGVLTVTAIELVK